MVGKREQKNNRLRGLWVLLAVLLAAGALPTLGGGFPAAA